MKRRAARGARRCTSLDIADSTFSAFPGPDSIVSALPGQAPGPLLGNP